MIVKVHINYTERNYFNDYDEIRSDETLSISEEKILKAIDKLHRRYRSSGECDCLLVENDDGTGYRLWYSYDDSDFDQKTSQKQLRLRHLTSWSTGGWDTEETVTVSEAKRRIIAG